MKNWLKDKKWFLLSLLVVFGITLLFPLMGDDWQWRRDILTSEYLHFLFTMSSFNGRYVANIIVLYITKNIVLRSIVISLVLCSIVEILYKETHINRMFSWILIGLMGKEMFKQAIAWTSGFTNYGISTLLLLINVLFIFNNFNKKAKISSGIFLLLSYFISSFFIENLTVFLLIYSLVMNLIYLIKNKKLNYNMCLAFLGSLIGNICMFHQPCYSKVLDGTDTYRSIGHSLGAVILRFLANYFKIISKYIAIENVFIILILIGALYLYYKKNKKDNKIINLTYIYLFMYSIYIFLLKINPNWNIFANYTIIFNGILTAIFLIILIIDILIIFYQSKDFYKILLIILTIIGLVAPLSVVSPLGARNFFMIYVLELFLLLLIVRNLNLNLNIKPVLTMILLVIIGYYVSIYGYISLISTQRLNYIYKEVEKGNTIVNVPYLPYSDYLWNPDFVDEYSSINFKDAYKIPRNIQFKFMNYDEWYNNFKK